MRSNLVRAAAVSALGLMVLAAGAGAEVDVSLTISGDLDEILAVLVQLRNMGIGEGVAAQAEDPLRLEVHSITVGSLDEQPKEAPEAPAESGQPEEPPPPPPPPPPDPVPNLQNAEARPPEAAPGESVTVSVTANDPDHLIDTVAVEFDTPTPIMRDLFDNGAEGDAQAGDGVWSRAIVLPPDLPPGQYTGRIVGFDVNGEPLTAKTEGGEPKRVQTAVTLTVTGSVGG